MLERRNGCFSSSPILNKAGYACKPIRFFPEEHGADPAQFRPKAHAV